MVIAIVTIKTLVHQDPLVLLDTQAPTVTMVQMARKAKLDHQATLQHGTTPLVQPNVPNAPLVQKGHLDPLVNLAKEPKKASPVVKVQTANPAVQVQLVEKEKLVQQEAMGNREEKESLVKMQTLEAKVPRVQLETKDLQVKKAKMERREPLVNPVHQVQLVLLDLQAKATKMELKDPLDHLDHLENLVQTPITARVLVVPRKPRCKVQQHMDPITIFRQSGFKQNFQDNFTKLIVSIVVLIFSCSH